MLLRECFPANIVQFLKQTNLFDKLRRRYCAPSLGSFIQCDSCTKVKKKSFTILIVLQTVSF